MKLKSWRHLHYRCKFGFDFFYGQKADTSKYTPISALEGHVMKWHIKKKQDCYWSIKDRITNAYFIAIVSKKTFKEHAPPSGSTPTNQYIEHLIFAPTEENNRILEALTPYAKSIQVCVGDSLYRRIKLKYPNYTALA